MCKDQLYHALKVNESVCYGCTHCMNVCPTQAIRIKAGIADINDQRCVDCGECLRACPVKAIYVEQDDFSKIFDFDVRVAVLPSVFVGQFSKQIAESEIVDVLKELGFTHVVPAEAVVDVINDAMLEHHSSTAEKPLISSFCPSIVRLVQIKFPGLVNNIMPLKSPAEAAVVYVRNLLKEQGVESAKVGVFYVTPCASKIAALKSQPSEDPSFVNGVINMNFLYNKVYHVLKNRSSDQSLENHPRPYLFSKGLEWSLTNGEAAHMPGRCLAIDEIHNVISFLSRVENDEVVNVDFLELRACDQGCAGGVLLTENRFITVERLHTKADRVREKDEFAKGLPIHHQEVIKDNLRVAPFEARPYMALDTDVTTALQKMERVRNVMCFLPGIDCGACGAPNCESLAQDIIARQANLSNCVFLQRSMEKSKKLDPSHSIRIIEKTWGKARLDKDCYKKGAKHES